MLEARVRGVLEPTKIPGVRLRDDLGAGEPSSGRASQPAAERHPVANRAQAAHAGAAHEPQQHRLELVVAVMCRQQHVARGQEVRERAHSEPRARRLRDPSARGARPRREPWRARRRASEPSASQCALQTRRIGMQPVIDVRRAQRRAKLETRKRREQDRRIDAAAERDDYARAVDRRRPTLERRTNARDERLSRRAINDIGIEPRHARTALRRRRRLTSRGTRRSSRAAAGAARAGRRSTAS